MASDSAASLIHELHGRLLRHLAAQQQTHFEGLAVAARQLRKQGIGSSRTWRRRLREVDVAYNFVRHITSIKIEQVFHEISKELLDHADHMADTITYTAPSSSVELTAPAPDVTYTESDPVIGHATLAPVDVYTKPAPVIELMPAPVTKYIAPYPAVSYPSAFSPVDKLNGVVNPQFSITADETSQMPVQEIPELHVVEQIQEQIMGTFSQESVQQRTDEQIVAVAAPSAATTSPSPPVSVIEHTTLAPVDVYTKTAPVVDLMSAPVIEYIAPSAAVSYPSFLLSIDQIHEAVTDSEKPQFSINADEISQMSVGRIHEQSAVSDLVTSVESSPVPLLHAVEYVMPEPRVIVQGIPRAQVGERIQEQIAETISQETVQQRTDEQIMAVAAPRAATDSPAPPVSVIEHATLTPVDVYTKPAPVIEPMAAPVIEYFAPSPAVSYPTAFSSVDRLNGVVNPQFSITADETSQMPVQEIPELEVLERIQEQIVGTISQESVQQRADERIVVVRVPIAQEQGFVPDIPRAQVVKRIREKRAHQRTVEQNVRAPVPTVREQRCVPEKPGAQGVEQMPKSLDRLLGASELEKEEAYWNEFCEDEDNIEQLYQEWLSGAFEPLFYEDGRQKKNVNRTVQVMERIPEHTVVSFDQEEKLNNIKF